MKVFLPRSASGARGDYLGANSCASASSHFTLGVYQPSSRTMHMDSPWASPSPGSYLSQGFSRGGVGTSRVRSLPTGTGDMALKPPLSFPYYCSEVPGPDASSSVPWPLAGTPPPRSSLPVGIGGCHHPSQNILLE